MYCRNVCPPIPNYTRTAWGSAFLSGTNRTVLSLSVGVAQGTYSICAIRYVYIDAPALGVRSFVYCYDHRISNSYRNSGHDTLSLVLSSGFCMKVGIMEASTRRLDNDIYKSLSLGCTCGIDINSDFLEQNFGSLSGADRIVVASFCIGRNRGGPYGVRVNVNGGYTGHRPPFRSNEELGVKPYGILTGSLNCSRYSTDSFRNPTTTKSLKSVELGLKYCYSVETSFDRKSSLTMMSCYELSV